MQQNTSMCPNETRFSGHATGIPRKRWNSPTAAESEVSILKCSIDTLNDVGQDPISVFPAMPAAPPEFQGHSQ